MVNTANRLISLHIVMMLREIMLIQCADRELHALHVGSTNSIGK
jgi:hypothetical protein